MKTKSETGKDSDLRREYALGPLLRRGAMGKYAARYRKGVNIVRLDPEVAKAFPSEASVNEALKLVMRLEHVSRDARKTRAAA
jgi:hypothetical protein